MWFKGWSSPVVALSLLFMAGIGLAETAPPGAPVTAAGRVAGRVTRRGGDAVESASVTLIGAGLGAFSDEHGEFMIAGVTPGRYRVRAQAMAFGRQEQGVEVRAGETTILRFMFDAENVFELPGIVVPGKRWIDPGLTGSQHGVPVRLFRDMRFDRLTDVVKLQPGLVEVGGEIHVRGGRGDEVQLSIDGLAATDPLSGRNPEIATAAVADAEVLTGGFTAEHGNALSGFVVVTTREGGEKFGGEVRWDTDRLDRKSVV